MGETDKRLFVGEGRFGGGLMFGGAKAACDCAKTRLLATRKPQTAAGTNTCGETARDGTRVCIAHSKRVGNWHEAIVLGERDSGPRARVAASGKPNEVQPKDAEVRTQTHEHQNVGHGCFACLIAIAATQASRFRASLLPHGRLQATCNEYEQVDQQLMWLQPCSSHSDHYETLLG
jgi:hypothetical protein